MYHLISPAWGVLLMNWSPGDLRMALSTASQSRSAAASRACSTAARPSWIRRSRPWGLQCGCSPGVTIAYMGPRPPDPQIPKFGSQRPRDPKNRIPRVRFMKNRPGARSGDLNRTDLRPYVGLAHICYSYPSRSSWCPRISSNLRGPPQTLSPESHGSQIWVN